MPWDFNGHGFNEWVKWGDKPRAGWHMMGVWSEDGLTRIPNDGTMLPEWDTLPEVDEGEL